MMERNGMTLKDWKRLEAWITLRRLARRDKIIRKHLFVSRSLAVIKAGGPSICCILQRGFLVDWPREIVGSIHLFPGPGIFVEKRLRTALIA
jgi:hypothetical protein